MKRADIPVPSPCAEDWSGMRGDEQRRYCDRCEHHVHNLSEMTEPQARQLLSTRGRQGRLCVRYASDRSGMVRFRRAAPRAAAAAVAVALLSSPADAALQLDEDAAAVEEDSGLLARLRDRVRRWLRPGDDAVAGDTGASAEEEEAGEEEVAEEKSQEELLFELDYITAGIYIDPDD